MPFYFYTPIYEGPPNPEAEDEALLATLPTGKSPGKTGDEGVEWVEPPSGLTVLRRDEGEGRFVLKLASRPAIPGWVEKSSADVLADYPGLQGVV